MKYLMLIFFLFAGLNAAISQKKGDILKQIRTYKRDLVKNAKFDQKESDVFSAIYVVISEKYEVTKESESRGYIEGKKESATLKETISGELRGDEPPYMVSFSIQKQTRTKASDGSYSDWKKTQAKSTELLALQTKLYEKLNGPIELTEELQKTIDDFNSKQDKERKKIRKGKHY